MLQSLNDIKSNSSDIRLGVVHALSKLIDNIIDHPNQPKFRRIFLDSYVVQNHLLPFTGAMEFLFEIGFVDDGSTSLVLPSTVSLSALNGYKRELLAVVSDDKTKYKPVENSFLKKMISTSTSVLRFEDKNLQNKALENLTPEDIETYSKVYAADDSDSFYHEKMMFKLMVWFKESFFKWFNKPTCEFCSSSTEFKGINHDVSNKNIRYAEIYECVNCHLQTKFIRYDICEQLLTTHIGRCGEWANCFTLFCRALGWEARLVVDITDHVWTEVWSYKQERWVHCDPCETALDKPLLYEKGWGKKLSYIIAYSNVEVQDVTWRYTDKSNDVLKRRTICPESELLNTVLSLSEHRQINLSLSRQKYLAQRRLKECIEMLFKPKSTDDQNYGGRSSGALDWRLARGEIQTKQFIWTPTKSEISNKKFVLKYSTAMDRYVHDDVIHDGWKSGLYSCSSLFRKEEFDWKIVYLCREENCEKSTIEWRFDFSTSGLVVHDMTLICTTALFNNGQVEWNIVGNHTSMKLPVMENNKGIHIDQMNGSDYITLSACLFGGSGDLAWQHSQILRQSINNQDYPFQISFNLKEK